MAIEKKDLKLLLELRKKHPEGESLAILGDCYFHFNIGELQEMGGVKIKSKDSEPKLKVDLKMFAEVLGFKEAETFDISGSPTRKIDLQKSIPEEFKNRFDWVIDAGTLYWCFDIASVWKNILSMLKKDGCVFHLSALSGYFGRGYYSFQPRMFADFYSQNGFEVLMMAYRLRPPHILYNKSVTWYRIRKIIGKIISLEKKLEWQKISLKNIFLKNAGRFNMEFSSFPTRPEPDMIPNNVLVGCFAKRIKKVPFTCPIPKNI